MWDVIGQGRIVAALARAIAVNEVPHALLFAGPAGAGKSRLALELAKALNCVGSEHPCQNCVHCRQIESGSHPDVRVLGRLEGKDTIAIQQVRELRDEAALRPFQGRKKVTIIAGAEALTAQAADALLKTLEEPQPDVTIVLTALDQDALPATILSRCRVLTLQAVAPSVVVSALEERGLDERDAEVIARLAQANVDWALRAAADRSLVSEQTELVNRLTAVFEMDLGARLDLAETLTAAKKDRSSLRRSLEILALLGRDIMRIGHGLSPVLADGSQETRLAAQARSWGDEGSHAYLRNVRRTMDRIDQNVDPRLALEALFMGLP